MRHLLPLIFVMAMLPAPVSADHGGIHISELLPDPEAGQREFVELWNDGPAVDLAGWTISDSASNTFTFPDVTLPTGGRIVLWGGGEGDGRGPAWSKNTVWNNGGDHVLLHDPSGIRVDSLAYGDHAWPDGRTDDVPRAPPKGTSLTLRDGAWIEAAPTPGSVATEQGGEVTATVEDVPPTATFTTAPGIVEPGASFTVSFDVADGNGPDDVATWSLSGDGVALANGTTAGAFEVPLSAPADRDRWRLGLVVHDHAGQQGNATLDVLIQAAGLVVVMPHGGIAFPPFPPGADEVLALATFTMRNDGDASIVPRIDFSMLSGPADIELTGRLHIGYESNGTTWTAYAGALTPLPAVVAGGTVEVRLKLTDLPAPLPAGSYGTSFAVVA